MQQRIRHLIGRLLAISCALALGMACVPKAHGAFIGTYDPTNWSLVKNNSDGGDNSPDSFTLVLTGGNNGSGTPGTTDFVIVAPSSGTVQFDFLYFSPDDPAFDSAGYLIGNTFFQLTNSALQSGTGLTFSVSQGQSFGFRVWTSDNGGEPGQLTISNFVGPEAVPEPATGSLLLLLAAGILSARLWSSRAKRRKARTA